MNAEQLRDQLVEVLAGASEPMSTTQARLAVTEYCRRRGPAGGRRGGLSRLGDPGAPRRGAPQTSRAAAPTGS